MSAVVAFLQSIIDAVGAAFSWLGSLFVGGLEGVWRAGLGLVDQLAAWVVQLVGWVAAGVVGLFFGFLAAVSQLLPAMPAPPAIPGGIGSVLALGDRYLPIHEALTLGLLWGTVYAAVFVYKGLKFLRGGG